MPAGSAVNPGAVSIAISFAIRPPPGGLNSVNRPSAESLSSTVVERMLIE
jgi:hypothetical protein